MTLNHADALRFVTNGPGQPGASGTWLAPQTATKPRRKRRLGLGKELAYGWMLGPILLLAYWSVGSASGYIDPRIMPAPWVAVTTAIDLIGQGKLQANLWISLQRAGEGLFFGCLAGVLLALFSGLTRVGGYLIDSLVHVKRSIPALALIPLFMLWFGIGEGMKVTVISFTVFFPIYMHTHSGLRGIDIKYVELAETLDIGRWDFIRHVVLPGALPGFLLGLRFGVTASWLALVVVEQINTTSGIGYMIELARSYAQSNIILVGLVVYGILGLSSDGIVRLLQKATLSWQRTLAN
jgi:sulfonate transport system permease protein